jgi:hypothetical protein
VSPDEALKRLARDLRGELARLGPVVTELADAAKALAPGCQPVLRMGIAGYLHSFYTGCESILARLAQASGAAPTGPSWHVDLLIQSAAPIEGVRPPVLRAETAAALHKLLQFRHFFRVQYGVELIVAELEKHAAAVPEAFRLFREDIARFLELMENAAE